MTLFKDHFYKMSNYIFGYDRVKHERYGRLATVLSVQRSNLLVFDFANRQQVQVNTNDAFRFCSGDLVRIRYNGAMTMSIPPQLSATSIVRISSSRC